MLVPAIWMTEKWNLYPEGCRLLTFYSFSLVPVAQAGKKQTLSEDSLPSSRSIYRIYLPSLSFSWSCIPCFFAWYNFDKFNICFLLCNIQALLSFGSFYLAKIKLLAIFLYPHFLWKISILSIQSLRPFHKQPKFTELTSSRERVQVPGYKYSTP